MRGFWTRPRSEVPERSGLQYFVPGNQNLRQRKFEKEMRRFERDHAMNAACMPERPKFIISDDYVLVDPVTKTTGIQLLRPKVTRFAANGDIPVHKVSTDGPILSNLSARKVESLLKSALRSKERRNRGSQKPKAKKQSRREKLRDAVTFALPELSPKMFDFFYSVYEMRRTERQGKRTSLSNPSLEQVLREEQAKVRFETFLTTSTDLERGKDLHRHHFVASVEALQANKDSLLAAGTFNVQVCFFYTPAQVLTLLAIGSGSCVHLTPCFLGV